MRPFYAKIRRLSSAVVIVGVALILLGSNLYADESGEYPFQYTVSSNVDEGAVTLSFRAPTSLDDAQITIERQDGERIGQQLGDLGDGDPVEVTFQQPPGTFSYDGTIGGTTDDGAALSFQLQMEVHMGGEFQVELLRDDVDLHEGVVPLRSNRPAERFELEVTDTDGNHVVEHSADLDGRTGRIDIEWQTDADVEAVEVTLYDRHGSWQRHSLRHIEVRLPQQVVNFETGSATLDSEDIAKLEKTRSRIDDAIEKHAAFRDQLRLYVAGYTDTVGPANHNLALSERRARAIAQWFRQQGVDIPIYYQGFGQEALAVPTPDDTEEEQNRRAVYVIANTTPTESDDIPRSSWSRLP